ncbi:MAG: amino acid ABC transporter permease [Anaerolineales bacterium]|nr:amino acid ABC transporter permease [Anaerolineales bacterium]
MTSTPGQSRLLPILNTLRQVPWWVLVAAIFGVLAFWQITTDKTLTQIFNLLMGGLGVTIFVSVLAYTLAMLVGLLVAFARLSKNPFIYHLATFYVEIVRGLPMLVLLLYIAFALIPGIIFGLNTLGRSLIATDLEQLGVITSIANFLTTIRLRDFSNLARVIIALIIGYSAFLSEVFRAGIQSIDRGQVEAARSLGMSSVQAMRHVVLPQALRNVLPALGNDFVAMVKDSSLVSVLGVQDITGRATIYMTGSFRTEETYTVMTFMYLCVTLILSLFVRWVERRSTRDKR